MHVCPFVTAIFLKPIACGNFKLVRVVNVIDPYISGLLD